MTDPLLITKALTELNAQQLFECSCMCIGCVQQLERQPEHRALIPVFEALQAIVIDTLNERRSSQ